MQNRRYIPTFLSLSVVHNLLNDESGQDLIEYALVAALIGLGAVVSIKGLGAHIANSFNTIGTNLTSNI